MSEPSKYNPRDEHCLDQETKKSSSALEVVDPSNWPLSPPPYTPTAPQNDFYSAPGCSNLARDQRITIQPSSSSHTQQYGQVKQSTILVDPSELEGLLSGGQQGQLMVDPQQSERPVIHVFQVMPEERRPEKRNSYIAHMLFSCSVFLCCGISGWVCGLSGFILALCANNKSSNGKIKTASTMGKASIILSVIGAVIGGILMIIIISSRK